MAALEAGWQPPGPPPPLADGGQPRSRPPGTGAAAAPPVEVEIARIGVRSDLVDLDLDDDRRLEVPTDPALAGWYVRGPAPG
jgi:hypothetical protein